MPEFCNPFTVMRSDRKLSKDELARAIRFMIAAEYEGGATLSTDCRKYGQQACKRGAP